MKKDRIRYSRQYMGALRKHLAQENQKDPPLVNHRLGRRAVTMGLDTLDLARIHGEALADLVPEKDQFEANDGVLERAHAFFVETLRQTSEAHPHAKKTGTELERLKENLRASKTDLTAVKRQLKRETSKRTKTEENLKKSTQNYKLLLEKSNQMRDELRFLAHKILSAQEEERIKISREIHDGIVQTLVGIQIQLATLEKEAATNTRGLRKKITITQRLVNKSAKNLHKFACDLRPVLLDNMGLIPALYSYAKDFSRRTGIRVHLTTCTSEQTHQMDIIRQTVLYRVTQEAMSNVDRHADATQVEIRVQKLKGSIKLKIMDNGKSFDMKRLLSARKFKRIGLIGMRERLQMVGGTLSIESMPGKGTTVLAEVPFHSGKRKTGLGI